MDNDLCTVSFFWAWYTIGYIGAIMASFSLRDIQYDKPPFTRLNLIRCLFFALAGPLGFFCGLVMFICWAIEEGGGNIVGRVRRTRWYKWLNVPLFRKDRKSS